MSATHLAERLRSRARFLPYGELDRILMIEASDVLATSVGSLDAEFVVAWLEDRNVKLLPWQRGRLGIEAGEPVSS